MKTEIVTVTPEQAAAWLLTSTPNRHRSDGLVSKYAEDMKAGRWVTTHQGIAFNGHGDLIDGQHRLAAIVKAGVPVKFQVSREVSAEARRFIDIGRPRSLPDIWRMESRFPNIQNLNLLAATARRMLAGMVRRDSPASNETITEFTQTHEDALDAILRIMPSGTQTGRVVIAPVTATMARAYYSVDFQRLEEFAACLISGFSNGPKDSSAILLRNLLKDMEKGQNRNAITNIQLYAKTESALASFVAESPLKILKAVSEEQYPLPEEKKRKKAA